VEFDPAEWSKTRESFGNPLWRLTNLYRISDVYARSIPLRLNKVQKDLMDKWTGRGIILKARQHGVSTLWLLRSLDRAFWNPNTWCAVVAHDRATLSILFNKIRFAWDSFLSFMQEIDPGFAEKIPRPASDNKYELYWRGLNSRIYVDLKVIGGTNHVVHFSEYAQISEDKIAETLPSVPPNGEIIIESTPREMGNKFYRDYMAALRGESEYQPFFYEWWWSDRYQIPLKDVTAENLSFDERSLVEQRGLTLEQIQWRRNEWRNQEQSDGSNLFLREFPEDNISCFYSAGDAAFDNILLGTHRTWLEKNNPPFRQGYMSEKNGHIGFREHDNGPLKVYQAPEKGMEYCLGADISLGGPTSDWQTLQVIRRDSEDQVAEYRIRTELGAFVADAALLGRFYNNAHICPERNSAGEAFIRELLDIYPKHLIYKEDDGIKVVRRRAAKYGYYSGRRGKQELISLLQTYLREDRGLIMSVELIKEMLGYQKYDLQNASEGYGFKSKQRKHDDRVIAFALALEMNRVLVPFKPRVQEIADSWDRVLKKSRMPRREVNWMTY
jgi:hypothetical protein